MRAAIDIDGTPIYIGDRVAYTQGGLGLSVSTVIRIGEKQLILKDKVWAYGKHYARRPEEVVKLPELKGKNDKHDSSGDTGSGASGG